MYWVDRKFEGRLVEGYGSSRHPIRALVDAIQRCLPGAVRRGDAENDSQSSARFEGSLPVSRDILRIKAAYQQHGNDTNTRRKSLHGFSFGGTGSSSAGRVLKTAKAM